MKFKSLVVLSLVALLTVGCSTQEVSQQPQTEAQTQTQVQTQVQPQAQPQTQPQTQTTAANNPLPGAANVSGTFQSAEHPTQGGVKVVKENGKNYLEFDENFKTDSGPDLFVILHRNDTLPINGIKEKDYVSIARLKNTSGTQRYEIPQNLNLADFKSVAVWCRQFNATFGYAPFQA